MGKHKLWRKLAKKTRRKRIRQKLARERDNNEEQARLRREQSPSYGSWLKKENESEEFKAQEEARIAKEQEEKWLRTEEEAQQRWAELQIKVSAAREERAKQAARIKEEWEIEQKKLKELKENKEKEIEEKQKRQEELQQQIVDFINNDGNIPEGMKTNFETNPSKPVCPFFQKTAACRFKDTCSRNHIRPGISRTLVIPNFYSHYSLSQTDSEYGNDFSLEFEHDERYEHFKEFFYDVVSEMEKSGQIKQFKVCCNHEVHLRGNVYVEYSSCRESVKTYQQFYGRWYGGRQLHIEFCNIESWKSAICGLFARRKCPKGSSCNFLHVFQNPQNLYNYIDLEKQTPTYNYDYENYDDDLRNSRWSESPERIHYTSKDCNSSKSSARDRSSSRKDSIHRNGSRHKHRSKHRSRSEDRQSSKINRKSRKKAHRKDRT